MVSFSTGTSGTSTSIPRSPDTFLYYVGQYTTIMDENTKSRFQIPDGAMRRIKKADPDDSSERFTGESEVIKKKDIKK